MKRSLRSSSQLAISATIFITSLGVIAIGCADPTSESRAVGSSPTSLLPSTTWHFATSSPAAQLGYAVAVGDFNGDGFDDLAAGEILYYDLPNDLNTGAVRVFYGSSTGFAASPDLTLLGPSNGAHFGDSIVACDLNGDTYEELVVGAPLGSDGGKVFVYRGSTGGVTASTPTIRSAPPSGTTFGDSLACAHLDSGQFEDLLVGAPGSTDDSTNFPARGMVYVYYGSASSLSASPSPTLFGPDAGGRFGTSVANAGDVNGDGRDDVIVGAPGTAEASSVGRVHLFLGDPSGLDATSDWSVTSDQGGSLFGHAVASAGDVDGNGCAEIAVGDPDYDDTVRGSIQAGRALVYMGVPAGVPSTTASWTEIGTDAHDQLGYSLASAGNIAGDSAVDLLVGAPTADPGGVNNTGNVLVFSGGPSGFSLDPVTEYNVSAGGTYLGSSVVGGANFDGDGLADVALGGVGDYNGDPYEHGVVFAIFTKTFTAGDGGTVGTTPDVVSQPAAGLCSASPTGRSHFGALVAVVALAFLRLRRFRGRGLLLALALATALASTAGAQATSIDSIARSHFEAGEGYYEAGRFAEAAAEFMRAYELSHHAALLHNAYVAFRDAGDKTNALAALERYVAEDPSANTPIMRGRIESLRAEIAADAAAAETVRATTTEATEPESVPEPTVAVEAAPVEDSNRVARRSGVILLGVGAGVAVAGFTTASVLLAKRESDLEAHCGPTATPPLPAGSCYDGHAVDAARRSTPILRGVAYGSLAAGAGLATAGLIRMLRHRDDEAPTAAVACDGRGCSFAFASRF